MSAEEIVRYFYGDDINFVRNAPIAPNLGGSWPGVTFRLGDISEEVRIIQNRLNRIRPTTPTSRRSTRRRHLRRGHRARGACLPAAVQPDRGRHRRPRDLVPHRVHLQQCQAPFRAGQRRPAARRGLPPVPRDLREGATGPGCSCCNTFLPLRANTTTSCPAGSPRRSTVFGPQTREAVTAYQRMMGLPETGVADRETWNALVSTYQSVLAAQPRNGWIRRSASRRSSWSRACAAKRCARRRS